MMMHEGIRRLCKSRLAVLIFGIVIGRWGTNIFGVPDVSYAKGPHQKDADGLKESVNRLLQAHEAPGKSIQDFYSKDAQWLKGRLPTAGEPRKILLDCGANVASTVQLFRETFPGGKDFIIHSFEIDERLAPYFAPYPNHVLHCPTGVSNKDGNMTAYLESVWSPDKDSEYQWGGGTLFAWESEKANTETGGRRKLTLHRTVPTVDLSRWIQENTAVEDYVIFKLDVEGAEYDILKKMLADGTFKWVDRYYGEFHQNQPVTGWDKEEMAKLESDVEKNGKHMLKWVAEKRVYDDIYAMRPGLSQPFPLGDFTQQLLGWIRVGLVSAIQRLSEVGLQPAYYCPENITDTLIKVAKTQGLRIIQPTARFPPTDEPWRLSFENYYKNIDVDRIPKALRVIAKQLDSKGGIVTLDSDHPDSYMISVFLMDYLVHNSGCNLVSIAECLKLH
ncbi:uncharacterized protein LOC144925982 isoform X2 [Branchiostoma floridae x Branchiostoma belcheri]